MNAAIRTRSRVSRLALENPLAAWGAAKALRRVAASPRLSLACIGAAATIVLAGFFFPRIAFYRSPYFVATALLLAGALAYSASLQARALARSTRRWSFEADALPEEDAIVQAMARRGYFLASIHEAREERSLFFDKHRAGRFGSFVFHGGLLLGILSGLWNFAFHQRGFAQLMEGETLTGNAGDFASVELGPLAGPFHPPLHLTLQRFEDAYWEDRELKINESLVSVIENGRKRLGTVAVNHPLQAAGCDIYQSNHFGYAATLLLERAGNRVATTFLLDQPPQAGRPAVGRAEFPTSPYWLRMNLSADRHVMETTVFRDGRIAFQGALAQGAPLRIGEDRLAWIGLRRWSGLIVTSHRGIASAYLAFALCVAGGALMLLLPWSQLKASRHSAVGEWRVEAVSRGELPLAAEEALAIDGELRSTEASRSENRYGYDGLV